MNSTLVRPAPFTLPAVTCPPRRLAAGETALVADWRRMLFLHFSLPPATLAPAVPFDLETYDGRAFVSLVFFSLENLRPPGTGGIGRLLLAPISDHSFLNVRTYVRHGGVGGIQFLAEWIPNPLSLRLGPALYGLPYRLGKFEHWSGAETGVEHLHLRGREEGSALNLTFPTHRPAAAGRCEPGSADEFLLERYTAYTFLRGVKRRFDVAHEPWLVRRPDWVRFDVSLVEAAFPWFRGVKFHSAHQSDGVSEVGMGRPHRLS